MTGDDPLLDRAVILAGGRSRRMGRDKALVELAGETLVCRAVRVLAGLFSAVGISCAGPEQVERLARVLDDTGKPRSPDDFVVDIEPGRGPLEGVRSALLSMSAPRVFFVAVDAPFLSPALISWLWTEACRPGVSGSMPVWRRGVEPAHAVYSRDLLPAIEAALAGDEASLRQMARCNGMELVDVEAPGGRELLGGIEPERLFASVNTPEDLREIEMLLARGSTERE